MDVRSMAASAVRGSGPLLARYLAGFTEDNRCAQAAGLPNHAAWTLGHLALTMHRAAEVISGKEMTLGWDGEGYGFGSVPCRKAGESPSLAEMRKRFEEALERVAKAVEGCTEAELAREVEWGGGKVKMRAWELAMRMVFHNGMHAGQMADMRRALGMGSVFK